MRLTAFLFVALAACAEFPALDGTIGEAAQEAPYPRLRQLPEFDAPMRNTDEELAARVAALQARAERLRAINIAALQ
ncbi:hypothetical protein [Loktanella sp. S4079]|uniref:hypothetical protein n=1 Tax=Loktanella sp. S4079 TaxID=579483 RepID=UPI0005F9F652|nr:hypothetical protein [Loktanella sp. S4079]KJZ19772.1 hypothetical protein TW80_02455 [Loktanella sp. S4079]